MTNPDAITVLGIGNTLLSDEGVGVHVVKTLQSQNSNMDGVTWVDGGTLSFSLTSYIEAATGLVIIDAARLEHPPGTVQLFEGGAMDAFLRNRPSSSVHEVSLADLLTVAHLAGELPNRRALVAVQPERVDWGDTLSDTVTAALPRACQITLELISRWCEKTTRVNTSPARGVAAPYGLKPG